MLWGGLVHLGFSVVALTVVVVVWFFQQPVERLFALQATLFVSVCVAFALALASLVLDRFNTRMDAAEEARWHKMVDIFLGDWAEMLVLPATLPTLEHLLDSRPLSFAQRHRAAGGDGWGYVRMMQDVHDVCAQHTRLRADLDRLRATMRAAQPRSALPLWAELTEVYDALAPDLQKSLDRWAGEVRAYSERLPDVMKAWRALQDGMRR